MEVPSPVEGSVIKLLAEEGETLPMGAAIAEVATAESPEGVEPEAAAIKVEVTTPGRNQTRLVLPATYSETSLLWALRAGLQLNWLNRLAATPIQAGPRPTAVVQPPAPPAQTVQTTPRSGQTRLSPAVRRLAQEHSIDISRIQGSGLGGRVTRDDVLRYLESGPALTPPSSTAPTRDLEGSTSVDGQETHISVSPVRRMIAEAMVRSVTEIPHAWSTVEVDVSGLVALRSSVRTEYEKNQGGSLTYLPFVIKAVVEALKEFPTMNATWGGDKIILKNRVNLGLAVAAPEGLIVPVIHNADQFSIAGLAAGANDLAERARTKKLTLGDVQGGTFTLNNTGALGSYVSGPIINYPQAGILTTETIQKRAMVIDDAIAIRSMMNLCLSFDHRINDGAEASGFLTAVKNKLQAFGPGTSIY
ncbi:MAG: hypothetical protein CM1200mP27_08580 [Chloroflexota bacterium]|nr:MAG: hypothetical protein CM1200mP27_08580 [Chloroflexota bacterium]